MIHGYLCQISTRQRTFESAVNPKLSCSCTPPRTCPGCILRAPPWLRCTPPSYSAALDWCSCGSEFVFRRRTLHCKVPTRPMGCSPVALCRRVDVCESVKKYNAFFTWTRINVAILILLLRSRTRFTTIARRFIRPQTVLHSHTACLAALVPC